MVRSAKSLADVNPMATMHRMVRGDRSAEVCSVVDPRSGKLVVQPESLKSVLSGHFREVFACPSSDEKMEDDEPTWFQSMYSPKAGVRSEWYDGLMADFTDIELLMMARTLGTSSAPGPDGVSVGIWKLGIEGSGEVRGALCLMFNACLRLRMMPTLGKESHIVPLPKKHQAEMTMSNIRPISLQASITKLLCKGLATRLTNII
jgi:hypothetical protein